VNAPSTGPRGVSDYDVAEFAVSIVVVSFNTRGLLRQCLESLLAECARLPAGLTAEVLVVDNASRDGSAEMVANEFSAGPTPVRLLTSTVNLGFGGANNLALEHARGNYLVLLNSDAFFHPGSLACAIAHMDSEPVTGLGGARLIGRNGEWQPSARAFPSIWNDALVLSGLSSRFPHSRIFGAPDRTWADPAIAADVEWVPGAFSILRREALNKAGLFDTDFFLYYEEVDLCRRIRNAGYRVTYWPDVAVTHIGGESSKGLSAHTLSASSSMVVLWRMRSTFLYYRKHHGWQARLALWLEGGFYALRRWRNLFSKDPMRSERSREAALLASLLHQAWRETNGGRQSPPRPW